VSVRDSHRIKAARLCLLVGSLTFAEVGDALAQPSAAHPVRLSASEPTATPSGSPPVKGLIAMSDDKSSTSITAEMKAAAALTTKVLAIGSWTAKADGSGAVFLMNVTDPAEAHRLLEKLPLGQAGMMTFELIPVGPLWPLGLLLREPAQ
jgi:hypothetical protein